MPADSPDEQPPEREFDQSTAWDRMESAAAEAIADLPDFPGFAVRTMKFLECSHNGEVDDEYVNLELSYQFSEEISQESLVRETYLDIFREQWEEAGYDIHRDQPSGTGKDHSLEARRPDGINYWYVVGGLTVLKVQSGCVKAVDEEEFNPTCPVPLGGVTRENDRATEHCDANDLVYPGEEEESVDAITPFEGGQAAFTPFIAPAREPDSFDRPGSHEGRL